MLVSEVLDFGDFEGMEVDVKKTIKLCTLHILTDRKIGNITYTL